MCCAMISDSSMNLYYVADGVNFVYKLVLYGPLFSTHYKLVGCQLSSNFFYMMETELPY